MNHTPTRPANRTKPKLPCFAERCRIIERYYYQGESLQQLANEYRLPPQTIRLMCYRLTGMGVKEAQLKPKISIEL
jgi:methylphosphotriester-DNA--protein-cysteine methyltransferase